MSDTILLAAAIHIGAYAYFRLAGRHPPVRTASRSAALAHDERRSCVADETLAGIPGRRTRLKAFRAYQINRLRRMH